MLSKGDVPFVQVTRILLGYARPENSYVSRTLFGADEHEVGSIAQKAAPLSAWGAEISVETREGTSNEETKERGSYEQGLCGPCVSQPRQEPVPFRGRNP